MFEKFRLDHRSHLLTGSGVHKYDENKVTNKIEYQVNGKYDDTENKIAFTETITENNGRPVTIFYKGDLSAARSCIKGKWGTDENCTDGGDFMITIVSDEKLTIKLQLHN